MKTKTILSVIIMLMFFRLAYAGIQCVGCRQQITTPADHALDCPYRPKNTGGGYSGGSSETQMMQSILQPFFNNLFAPPNISGQNEIDRQNAIRQQQQEKQEQEQKKQAAIQRWLQLQNEEAIKKQMEDEAKIRQGEKVLSQMKTVGGGKLEPFSIGNPKLDLKSSSTGIYPTAQLTEWEKLLCTAYFSNMANQSTSDVDARFYADQAQRVMSGEPTDIECKLPQVSNEKLAKRMEEVKKLYNEMNVKVKDLREVEGNLTKTRKKIKDSELKKEKVTVQINELQARAATATPEEKAEVDPDLYEAQKLLQDAEQELNQAKQSEKDALNKKEQLENELGNMKAEMQAKIQAGDQ